LTETVETDSLVQLDFELNLVRVIQTYGRLCGIQYDVQSDKLYVVSYTAKQIQIYDSKDEETRFDLVHSIPLPINTPLSLALYLNNLYLGHESGTIYKYNAVDYSYINEMASSCSGSAINSIKFDCNGNMAYSCRNSKTLNILYKNGEFQTKTFTQEVYAIMFDSSNRLWVAADENLSIFN
jgi:hypothetical protein